MTGSIDILGPHDPALGVECIEARTELAEKFSDFSTKSKAGLSDADAQEMRTWLDGHDFERTCSIAETDPQIMTAIFSRQIYLGQNHRRDTSAKVIPLHKPE